MMKEVATRIQQDVLQAKLKAAKMSWAEHLERGHTHRFDVTVETVECVKKHQPEVG